jgi:hypothetical protein
VLSSGVIIELEACPALLIKRRGAIASPLGDRRWSRGPARRVVATRRGGETARAAVEECCRLGDNFGASAAQEASQAPPARDMGGWPGLLKKDLEIV